MTQGKCVENAVMQRAIVARAAGHWDGPVRDAVELDFDARHRRRIRLTGEAGLDFLLDLPEVPSLREGDGLELESGDFVVVRCAPESLLEVRADDAITLARLAWHLGNRHLPTAIAAGVLRIRSDHVIANMLRGLGADVREVQLPFHPEGGAYGKGRTHAHDHEHSHGHAHDHHH